jgi:3,4-dihydroxy 2-butanone 4-phosphate synthase/GTP cyclohydrolase II
VDVIDLAVSELRRGRPVVLVDDSGTGHLVVDGTHVTPAAVAFLARHSSGLLYAVLPASRADELGLPALPATSPGSKAEFAVSADLTEGVSTGISAPDRAATLQALADPHRTAGEFHRPGHVLPVRAHEDGALGARDAYHCALDLARLTGTSHCAALATLVDPAGALLVEPDTLAFADHHDLTSVTVSQVLSARMGTVALVDLQASAQVPVRGGVFTLHAFQSRYDTAEHVALSLGSLSDLPVGLVRAHPHCWLGSVAKARSCTCAEELDASLDLVSASGRGVVVVLATNARTAQLQCAKELPVDRTVLAQLHDRLGVSIRVELDHPVPLAG